MIRFIYIIALLTVVFSSSRCYKETFEVILIPRNFEGRVYIVYDEPQGEEAKIKGDTIYFHIPQTGILVTKSSLGKNVNLMNSRYFFADNLEPIIKIDDKPYLHPCHNCIYNDGIAGSFSDSNKYVLKYRMIVVGIPNDNIEFGGVCDTSKILKSLR